MRKLVASLAFVALFLAAGCARLADADSPERRSFLEDAASDCSEPAPTRRAERQEQAKDEDPPYWIGGHVTQC